MRRKHIASLLLVRPNLVSDSVRTLIHEGWVSEGPARAVRSGRTPIPLFIDGVSKLAVAVTYSADGLVAALVNAHGREIRRVGFQRMGLRRQGRGCPNAGRCRDSRMRPIAWSVLTGEPG